MTVFSKLQLFAVWFACVLLAACSGNEEPASLRISHDVIPGSYQGTLPCADCPGIDYHLALFDDQAFYLEMRYQDRPAPPLYYIGRWQLRDQGKLLLSAERENFFFAFQDTDSLRLLDQTGNAIDSQLPYTLTRDAQFQPVYPQLLMRGVYSYMADAGLFTECLTGQRWKVAQLEDNRQLEQHYLEMRETANQPLFVAFDGRLINEPNPDTGAPETAVVVENFKGIWPVEACAEPGFVENLLETHWQLSHLRGQALEFDEARQYPTLMLTQQDDTPSLTGSDGCNRIMGQFQLRENRLRFSKIASTMMACQGIMETAQAYHEMLETVHAWQIRGQTLELFDRDNRLIAQFHAIPDA